MGTAKKEDAQVHRIRAAVLRRKGGPLSIETLEMEGPRVSITSEGETPRLYLGSGEGTRACRPEEGMTRPGWG
jgi:hypothetical protein